MKIYSEYWKKRILQVSGEGFDAFCRDEEVDDACTFAFVTETYNNGPCCMCAGVWLWSHDLNLLASWIIEFQMRMIFATCDEGKDIAETLDMTGTEYLHHIADASKGIRGEDVRKKVAMLAEELATWIDCQKLTFDCFFAWIKKYETLSEDMPVLVTFDFLGNFDDAMVSLRAHEKNRAEDLEALDLEERFQIDCIC